MSSPRLNRRVLIQKPAEGRAPSGQPLRGWVDLAAVWADVRNLNGLQTIRADAATSAVKASIRIRWRTDVTAAMRVKLGNVAYDIKAILDDQAGREFVDLVCERVNG